MTASEYNYLLALYKLSQEDKEVRIVDLAELTKISKASVYHALNRLINKGLAERSLEEATYRITKEGEDLIISYVDYVKQIQGFLESKLSLDKELSYNDAISICCAIEPETRDALLSYIKN